MTSPAVPQGIPDGLAKLREPFPESVRGKLFKAYDADEGKRAKKQACAICHAYHSIAPGIHLDYVGHAAVTDRLLEHDPLWNWEPMAMDENGLPRFILDGAGFPMRLWIRLTVCGVTRLGVGSVKPGANEPEKQLIGNAIKNAAMRFGVGLDMWSKDELESQIDEENEPPARPSKPPKDTRPKEVRDMEKRGAQHDALANTDAATKAREQMAAELLDREPRSVLGIPVLLTWPVAKDMQIGTYAAGYKPGVPSAKDLALKTWGWASEGSSQGEREAFLESLVNRARELVKKSPDLPNNLQCAVLAYQRMTDRFATAPVSEGEV